MSHLIKTLPVADQFCHVDRQTDRHDEADSGFAELCEPAKQSSSPFFFRPTGWTATGPVTARYRLAHSN